MSSNDEEQGDSVPHPVEHAESSLPRQEAPRRRSHDKEHTIRSSRREALIRTLMYKSPEELELVFRNLEYTVLAKRPRKGLWHVGRVPKNRITILKGITAQIAPRRLTAILGSSGAGKTILLSVLSGTCAHNNVHVDGTLLVNGESHSTGMLRKITGLVRQDDILQPHMTAREAIEMSARLRLPSTLSARERAARVKALIDLFDLEKVADVPAGSALVKGLCPAERRKTMIAMEMVINPAILLLDEPTTGLDSAEALKVVYTLRGLSRQGRTVVAAIHQPGTEVFNLFDDVIILCRGRIAYAGSVSKMVDYFACHGYQCPRYVNPSDFVMMNVLCEFDLSEGDEELADSPTTENTSQGHERLPLLPREEPISLTASRALYTDRIERILREWDESSEARALQLRCQYRPHVSVAFVVLRHQAAWWRQLQVLLSRAFVKLGRDPRPYCFSLIGSIYAGLLVGLTYVRTDDFDPYIQIRNKSAGLFLLAGGFFINNSRGMTVGILRERTTFASEYDAGYYGVGSYYASKMIMEMLSLLIFSPLFLIICYYLIGLTPAFSSYLFMLLLLVADAFCGLAYGAFFGVFFDDLPTAINVAYIPYVTLGAVSGIFVGRVPDWVLWLRYLSPIYYTYSGLLQIQFSGGIPDCDPARFLCTENAIYQDVEFTPIFSPGVDLIFLIVIFIVLYIIGNLVLLIRVRMCLKR